MAWPRIERSQAAEAYARRVLLRTYLSQRRLKRSTEVPMDVNDLVGRLVDPGGDHDLQLSLAAALRQLPPRDRAVMVLHYLEGHDTATIADYLNTTPAAVKSLNLRSLRLLRAQLGESREALFSPQNQ